MTSSPPQEVRLLKASRTVEILWGSGHLSSYAFSTLRKSCLCSECKSAMTREQSATYVEETVAVTSVVPVGNYALQFFFDDGHERGIYPYEYLRGLAAGAERG